MAQFRFGVLGIGHGGLNLCQKKLPIALPQAMHGDRHGTGCQAKPCSRFRVVAVFSLFAGEFSQGFKQLCFATPGIIGLPGKWP